MIVEGEKKERERDMRTSRVVDERRAMTDVDRREKTARDIARTRASIRKKHRALKTGKMESETALETRFKPIVEPLRRIAERVGDGPARDASAREEEEEEEPAKREIDDDDDVVEAFARGAKRTVALEKVEEGEDEEESALPQLSAKGFKAKRSRRSSATTSTPWERGNSRDRPSRRRSRRATTPSVRPRRSKRRSDGLCEPLKGETSCAINWAHWRGSTWALFSAAARRAISITFTESTSPTPALCSETNDST